ncbi:MAG: T9SS type A sorting domain-containing protein [Fidelibacterota bacterium]
MSKKRQTSLGVLLSLVLGNPVWGHVDLIYPVGGETFEFGDKVNIQWQITIQHEQENWDLYFSPDGGVSWEVIESNLGPAETSYQWSVPQVETELARIRIYMDNVETDYDDISGDFTIRDAQASLDEQGEFPRTPALYPNYPNPFNPATTIDFSIPHSGFVTLTVYDLLGGEVETILNQYMHAGNHSVLWNATNVPSGLYFVRMEAGDPQAGQGFTRTRKMVLFR